MSIKLSLRGSGGSIYDSAYATVLARASTLGYTQPGASQKFLQNNLIISLKAAGIWDKLDVLYMFANNGSKEFATLNWKNPSLYQATLVNNPTWTSNAGFKGNATSAHVLLNWNISTNAVKWQQNSASRLFWIKTTFTSGSQAGGIVGSIENSFSSTNGTQRVNQGTVTGTGSFAGTGMRHSNRADSATVKHYKDGVLSNTVSVASAPAVAGNATVFRSNVSYGDCEISFIGFGESMDSLAATLNTIFSTYMAGL